MIDWYLFWSFILLSVAIFLFLKKKQKGFPLQSGLGHLFFI
jgi:hypothetical protein